MELLKAAILFVYLCSPVLSATQVKDLAGEAQFRSIHLQWKYEKPVTDFVVTYCEVQAWGKYRCRKQAVKKEKPHGTSNRVYDTTIDGLRMATNYTVKVIPQDDPFAGRGRAIGREILIQTKGFSAKATNCLANASVVEVETGPYFGGKVSVESSSDPRCAVSGNSSSPLTTYMLVIDQKLCGSEVKNSSVFTYVIVQENLPILTHSTRRFMVVCNYVPETFTVRAGVSLPDEKTQNKISSSLVPVDKSISEVDPSELFDSTNVFNPSFSRRRAGKSLKFPDDEEEKATDDSAPRTWAHLVFMIILVIGSVMGIVFLIWHFTLHPRPQDEQSFMASVDDPSVISPDVMSVASVIENCNNEYSSIHSLCHGSHPSEVLEDYVLSNSGTDQYIQEVDLDLDESVIDSSSVGSQDLDSEVARATRSPMAFVWRDNQVAPVSEPGSSSIYAEGNWSLVDGEGRVFPAMSQ